MLNHRRDFWFITKPSKILRKIRERKSFHMMLVKSTVTLEPTPAIHGEGEVQVQEDQLVMELPVRI